MKLNVEIHQDAEFIRKVKELVLNQVNSVLKEEANTGFKVITQELTDRYLKMAGKRVPDLVEKCVKEYIEKQKFPAKRSYGYDHKLDLAEYIKETIEITVHNLCEQKVTEILADILKKKENQ